MNFFVFKPDQISILFTSVVTVVFILALIYSFEYMKEEEHKLRFYLFFGLTYVVLLFLFSAGNLLTFYFFYELMSILSLPLVMQKQTHEAVMAGLKYLFYSLFGAYLVLFGLFVLNSYTLTFDFCEGGILDMEAVKGNEGLLYLALLFMLLGFSVKAGMFPMHAWLPTAHPIAPSPASAILSGVIVKCGVLGIIRTIFYVFGPSFYEGSVVQTIMLVLSLITVFMGSMLAFREKLFKKRLAYSTVSQISYILFGIFLIEGEAFTGSLLHFICHALVKSGLFLSAGFFIKCTGDPYVTGYKGLARKYPLASFSYLLLSLSLIGIPPTGGFLSKWHLAVGSLASGNKIFSYLGPVILLISALLTAGYLLPVALDLFNGKQEQTADKKAGPCMAWPIAILAVLALLIGMFPEGILKYLDILTKLTKGMG